MKTILFCIPYAGGSATVYMQWKQLLGNHIEIYPVELAGRGARYDEPHDPNFTSMMNDLVTQIKPYAENNTYAIFGHSMGAVLAYELYYMLAEEGFPLPVHLFLSGRPAPVQHAGRKKFRQVLKSDVRLMNTYVAKPKQAKINCPVTIFSGKHDEISEAELLEWNSHTNNDCKIIWLYGDHFFLHSRKEELVSVINQTIPVLSSS
jgi:surfactin synthase thioesterase subunit